ncbi:MAG TPA: zinc-dependent metalloprotease [Acidimicrobiales bacterium]|nr:zinc-dependent metalloprotease [Acidimicrobiales bacterium]
MAEQEVTDPVSWEVARRVARQALRFAPPLDPSVRAELEADFAELTPRAEELVAELTGLHSADGAARGRVTDRVGWVDANVSSFRRLLRPLGERLASSEGPLQRALGPGGRAAAGTEVGLILAWISSRVLGQYDLLPVDTEDDGDIVYYVGPNIVALERRHAFPPKEFRLWIALHEVTHRLQFTGVPWMRDYFLSLVERGTSMTAPDAKALLESLRRAATQLRDGRNPLAEGGVVGLLASSDQLATLHEVQALMSLLEGHGDIVMSRAGKELVPGAERFARVLSERRSSAKGVAKFLQQAMGIEAKLRQYAEGERFVEAVIEHGGDALLAQVWQGPELLPTLEEVRDPESWVRRVEGVTSPVS